MAQRSQWSRRKFHGSSALGVLALSACAGEPAAPQVQVAVPPDVVDEAAALRGTSVAMLSQKLYSESANEALDRSLEAFAGRVATPSTSPYGSTTTPSMSTR